MKVMVRNEVGDVLSMDANTEETSSIHGCFISVLTYDITILVEPDKAVEFFGVSPDEIYPAV